MRELLSKEWRENRALIIGLLVLGPAASLLLRWWTTGEGVKFHAADPASALLPFLMAIYVLAIGADLFSADIAGGRMAFLVAQPVRLRTIWMARVTFLFGTAILYLGWILATESFLLLFQGIDPTRLFTIGLVRFGVRLIPAVVAAAAVLFFSVQIDRGFASVIATLGTLAAVVGIVFWLHPEPKKVRAGLLTLPVVLLFAAFLVGSFVAFTRGRIHLGGRLRRLGLAAAAFLLIFVVPVGLLTARTAQRLRIDLDDEKARPHVLEVDEDRKRVLVSFSPGTRRDERTGLRWRSRFAEVDLETGQVHDLGFDGPERLAESGWSPTSDIHYANGVTAVPVGKNTWEFRVPGRDPIRVGRCYPPTSCANHWGIVVKRTWGKIQQVVRIDTGEILTVPGMKSRERVVLLSEEPGESVYLSQWSRGVSRVPLAGGPREVVLESGYVVWNSLSPAGGHLVSVADGQFVLIRASGNRVIPLRLESHSTSVYWEPGGTRFLVGGRTRWWIGDSTEEEPTLTQTPIPGPSGRPVWFGGEQVLMEDRRLVLWTLDGTSRQILPVKEIP